MSNIDQEFMDALEDENDALRAQVVELKRLLGVLFESPLQLNLTSQESSLFGVLLNRELLTKDMAMFALYGATGEEPAQEKIIDVFVCKIRKKLDPFKILIHTKWGVGWYMDEETKSRVSKMMPRHLVTEPAATSGDSL